ncbi:hypothetical protein MVES_003486 [Malassezia vespertilionis]|uniref:CBS domain-containing protein n=1 Tax=Malassezia vespertilionis TaxID=2020962 RepID=A0A2N1J7K1_9BASI|nr:hypothetical protein MVES_003486 [Malassezia vespertilionis]
MSASPYRASPQQDTRKRQTRRDEAIRKRIEGELSRKAGKPSTPTQNKRRGGNAASGTVSALRPLPALTVPQSMSITDASQLCAAKRTDCVLVVDDDEHLAGIFTAKDLAYRIVAENLDPRATSVSEIMTTSPMVTRDTTNATDALNTMVTRGFRHLPVCNEDGDVIGLLDIAKVFYEALEKLERAHGTSQKLYNALEGVQNEWGGSAMGPQQAMMQYVESLREHMSMPDLNSILDSRTLPCTVGVRTSVRDAAKVMKQYHTTAVCVMENGPSGNAASGQGIAKGKIAGIFTSKDIVLRVIAAGLDPKTCSVIRVMTPHPETSSPSLNIQEALRKMHDGHFLNLPVVDVDARLVGVVDVLKLTYATLEQVNSMGDEQGSGAGGPMWNRFWNSFGQSGSVDESSAVSGSQQPYSPHTADLTSDVHPNDSASAVGASTHDGASNAGVPEMDDGTYLFKFVTPSGRVHRFQARYDNFETIHEIVMIKLANDPFFLDTSAGGFAASSSTMRTDFDQDHGLPAPIFTPPMPSGPSVNPPSLDDFHLAYKDDEDDLVLITTDGDVLDSVAVAKHQGKDRVLLILQGGRTWDEAASRDGSYSGFASSSSVSAANLRKRKAEAGGNAEAQGRRGKSDHIFGFFPKDLALPAAIGFLGIAVLGAVTLTRANAR